MERPKYTPTTVKGNVEDIGERIEQLRNRKAEIDSKISNNEQLAAKVGSKADPIWKKYQMQQQQQQVLLQQSRAQQDASRIRKSTSLHSDV